MVFILGLISSSGNTLAQRRSNAAGRDLQANCQLQSGGESTVLAVAGPQTLHLADGRFVRLAEILVPSSPQSAQGFDPSLAATSYLKKTALGQKVELKFGGTQRDRYGVYIGHIYRSGDQGAWLQEGLLQAGLAQVFPQDDNHSCSGRLLTSEASAREEKRGHWGLAYFKVLRASDPRSILNLVQTYQIVEGKVDHATESGGRITLHFGAQDKFGFIGIIEPGAKKRFGEKKAADDWAGLSLRIRGWIERRRGPSMVITQSEQIEVLPQTEPQSDAPKAGTGRAPD